MISEKFEEVVYKRRKFPDAVCRKRVSNNPIFCQFCNCQVDEICYGIRGKLKHDNQLKGKTCIIWEMDTVARNPGTGLDDQALDAVSKFIILLIQKKA